MTGRLLLLALLLAPASAGAFLFGGSGDKAAARRLREVRAAFESGDCRAALEGAELFLEEKPPAGMREEAYGYMGSCYESCGSADKAINLYKLAIELFPDNSAFALRLGLLYNRTGFHANAVPLLLKALALRREDPGAVLGLARAYAAQGFLARAKEYYGRASELAGHRDGALLEEYARAMLRKRDWAEVRAAAARGRLLSPRSAVWPRLEARAAAGAGDYFSAVALMETAIKFNSDRASRLERALYLLMGGLPARAAEAAEPELAADGADPLACAVKGMALRALGRGAEAGPYFERARAGGGPFTAAVAGAFLKGPEPAETACTK